MLLTSRRLECGGGFVNFYYIILFIFSLNFVTVSTREFNWWSRTTVKISEFKEEKKKNNEKREQKAVGGWKRQ